MRAELSVAPLGRYSVQQAADALGISRRTLYRLAERGQLMPRVHKGTMRRYYRGQDIIRYYNS